MERAQQPLSTLLCHSLVLLAISIQLFPQIIFIPCVSVSIIEKVDTFAEIVFKTELFLIVVPYFCNAILIYGRRNTRRNTRTQGKRFKLQLGEFIQVFVLRATFLCNSLYFGWVL